MMLYYENRKDKSITFSTEKNTLSLEAGKPAGCPEPHPVCNVKSFLIKLFYYKI
jgi:hypothetical protein